MAKIRKRLPMGHLHALHCRPGKGGACMMRLNQGAGRRGGDRRVARTSLSVGPGIRIAVSWSAAIRPGGLAARRSNEKGSRLLKRRAGRDRKSTRLNSSHVKISYAVFCLKKK